jgi:hypothetical protein
MKPQSESKNIVAVRRLYEARGNPDIVKPCSHRMCGGKSQGIVSELGRWKQLTARQSWTLSRWSCFPRMPNHIEKCVLKNDFTAGI